MNRTKKQLPDGLVFRLVVVVHLLAGFGIAYGYRSFAGGWEVLNILFFAQANLAGIWAALGPRLTLVRLLGFVSALTYLGFALFVFVPSRFPLDDVFIMCLGTSFCVALALMLLGFIVPLALVRGQPPMRQFSIRQLMLLTFAAAVAAGVTRAMLQERDYLIFLPYILPNVATGILVACSAAWIVDSPTARFLTLFGALAAALLFFEGTTMWHDRSSYKYWMCICGSQGGVVLLTLATIRWYAIPRPP